MDTIRRMWRDVDWLLIAVVLVLTGIGCIAVGSATRSHANPSMPTHAALKQAVFALIGLVVMVFATWFDYRMLRRVRWILYGLSLVLLVVVFAFPEVNGAKSWIQLGPFSFQPSELAKLTLILVIASYMAGIDESEVPDYRLWRWLPVIAMWLPPFALTMKEPALGQALVMFAITCTLLATFAKTSQFRWMTALFVVVVAGLVVISVFFDQQAVAVVQYMVQKHWLHDYQANRILTWLDPAYGPRTVGYNVHQAEVAIGSGGVFGAGLFRGTLTGGGWVPNQWTDYIFSAIGEEMGFVGSSLVVVLYILLVQRLVRIAGLATDTFGTYLVMGMVGMFAFQAFENIGMDLYMSPSTGITLPFVSYGGTSLVVNYLCIGVAMSVAVRRRKLRFH
ncbi:MAG: rod shape-determining protein RodA [Thermoflavifilum sp.]|nr:rod shape-determining protein RodA [Thermoflavifilum sp.]MCL6514427.1 rod shape-determining protein RodA [Alicyclobacillus sp.]